MPGINIKKERISLAHGAGGALTSELIGRCILKYFKGAVLGALDDSAVIDLPSTALIFTSDSFTVNPLFFPGGNIGKLAVCGTVNDILAQGGDPLYMSMNLIIEEGFSFSDLERIMASMAREAEKCGIELACGDTKVVEKGKCDGLFISCSGIGRKVLNISPERIKTGDPVIINGTAGEHEAAIFNEKSGMFSTKMRSDCEGLTGLFNAVKRFGDKIHFMRDPTRGGIAHNLHEIAVKSGKSISLKGKDIPVGRNVLALAELTGMDHLYFACEGRMLIICSPDISRSVVSALKKTGYTRASVIGIVERPSGSELTVEMKNGKERILKELDFSLTPRIC